MVLETKQKAHGVISTVMRCWTQLRDADDRFSPDGLELFKSRAFHFNSGRICLFGGWLVWVNTQNISWLLLLTG